MKIKTLLTALILVWGLQSIYGQQATVEGNFPLHLAPPRKEIRHKLKQWPQDNGLQQTATRAAGADIPAYRYKMFPTMGEMRGVVILAAFADVPFSMDDISINELLSNRLNADDYSEEIDFEEYSEVYGSKIPLQCTIPGSARDYFRDQSFGQFSPSFDVIGPVTLSQKRSYYGANDADDDDMRTSAMIKEACQIAYDKGLTDFKSYDKDGDKVVDFVYVVYAGSDEAQTGIEEAIWAKASDISLTLGNGMKMGLYACSGELFIDLPVVAGIGTFVHEFSHILGLPDFYNTETNDFTMDSWSVMDYGSYNAEGFVPCAYTAFERYSLGWIPMYTFNAPATAVIGTTEEEKMGYRIFAEDLSSTDIITPADTAAFYLIETIRQEGWNRYAGWYAEYYNGVTSPIEGLLITEVTYDQQAWQDNEVNVDTHRCSIVPANNNYSYKTVDKHLFGNTNQEFTITSASAKKTLTNIVYDGSKTTFDFCGGGSVVEVSELKTQNLELGIFYDLFGRPVAHPTKGIYIVNGKKTIIK